MRGEALTEKPVRRRRGAEGKCQTNVKYTSSTVSSCWRVLKKARPSPCFSFHSFLNPPHASVTIFAAPLLHMLSVYFFLAAVCSSIFTSLFSPFLIGGLLTAQAVRYLSSVYLMWGVGAVSRSYNGYSNSACLSRPGFFWCHMLFVLHYRGRGGEGFPSLKFIRLSSDHLLRQACPSLLDLSQKPILKRLSQLGWWAASMLHYQRSVWRQVGLHNFTLLHVLT